MFFFPPPFPKLQFNSLVLAASLKQKFQPYLLYSPVSWSRSEEVKVVAGQAHVTPSAPSTILGKLTFNT